MTLANRDAAERAITQMDQSQLDGVSGTKSLVVVPIANLDLDFSCPCFRSLYLPFLFSAQSE